MMREQLTQKKELIGHYIDLLLSNSEFYGLLINGKGGLGKTYLSVNYIKKHLNSSEYAYFNGHITPLSIYLNLFENKDKKVIIFDDIDNLLTSGSILGILKGVLSPVSDKRIVQYHSTTNLMDGVPAFFEITAKIIIICNSIPRKSKLNIDALLSRLLVYKVNYTYSEKKVLLLEYIRGRSDILQKDKVRILKLIKNSIDETTLDLNYRLIQKIIAISSFAHPEHQKMMIKSILHKDKDFQDYLSAVKRSRTKKEAVKIYTSESQKSRASFYRIEQRYIQETGINPNRFLSQSLTKNKGVSFETEGGLI